MTKQHQMAYYSKCRQHGYPIFIYLFYYTSRILEVQKENATIEHTKITKWKNLLPS